MKKNKPRTIADLKFNWKFVKLETYPSLEVALDNVFKKNPHLKEYKIIRNKYSILVDDAKISIYATEDSYPTVLDFFEYICFRMSLFYPPIIGKFSHFERIDDQTYRLHLKS
jgi:hypothetical protein